MAMKFLKKAGRSADRLEQLVKDLLSITRLESGDQELRIESFDVLELVKEIFDSLEMRAKSHNVRLEFKHNYIVPIYVDADKKIIRQAFVNLIINSIKYGKSGGLTQLSFYDLDQSYLIEVSDDGEGIAAEHLPRLFERFYRIDNHRSREDGGTGLGLAIVKHAVEAHGETVNVRSTLGLGSTFGFTLHKTKRNILQEVLEV
jgi:two-component system phosphate regulon sensor histidine kinase PhoR